MAAWAPFQTHFRSRCVCEKWMCVPFTRLLIEVIKRRVYSGVAFGSFLRVHFSLKSQNPRVTRSAFSTQSSQRMPFSTSNAFNCFTCFAIWTKFWIASKLERLFKDTCSQICADICITLMHTVFCTLWNSVELERLQHGRSIIFTEFASTRPKTSFSKIEY